MRLPPVSSLVVASALTLLGCGGSTIEGKREPESLRVVVAVPKHGPNAGLGRDIERAARMQFEDRTLKGPLKDLELFVVDESSSKQPFNDPEVVAGRTQEQIDSAPVVGWVGGVDSDALAVELPRLNEAGIPAVSPSSTATPFNRRDAAFPGAPIKYYPAFAENGLSFARTAPTDLSVAARCLREFRGEGIKKVFTVDAGDTDGDSFSSAIESQSLKAGVTVVGHESIPTGHADWEGITQQIVASGAQTVVWGSAPGTGENELWTAIAASGRRIEMYVGPAFPTSSLVNLPAMKGQTRVCSAAVPADQQTSSSSAFARAFRERWGHPPQPGSVRGAAAMSLMLDALEKAAVGGRLPQDLKAGRQSAIKALARTRSVDSLLGKIQLDRLGNWNTAPVGIWALQGSKVSFSP